MLFLSTVEKNLLIFCQTLLILKEIIVTKNYYLDPLK